MDILFSYNNTHLDNPNTFSDVDPHLRKLKTQPYVFESPLLQLFPFGIPGVYTLGGGRQIGKTTFLKQWIASLLQRGVPATSILFLTGELIYDHYSLLHIMREALEEMSPKDTLHYIIIDEVTYIREWDKAIKFLADSGLLEKCVVVLTGSDLVLMNEARMRFPGRRGRHHQVDFHYYPLSFREYVDLVYRKKEESLYEAFQGYLLHGGFLTAINDIAIHGEIQASTFQTYSDWIRGDFLKRGKKEKNLRDLLSAILKTYGTQVTWVTLTHHIEIDHPKTIQDYVDLMQSMDALFIQEALIEHKLIAAPKKAKRLFFSDPFIYHAIRMWLEPKYRPVAAFEDPSVLSSLVETGAINIIRRLYPTYYIKAEGEVDVAYVKDSAFHPIEIKWTNQTRPKDIKQIKKYPQGQIWSKVNEPHMLEHIPVLPLPKALYEFA
jgi:predicted AAA+ superfamily ATPase